jgi:phage regulator Rha-like protein
VGSPDRVRETLKIYEQQHLDVMIFVAQCGDRKHEHIMESIETFGKELLPEFKERHEIEHKRWRAEQLQGVDYPVNSSI